MASSDGGLRPLFRQHVTGCDWQSVETAITGGGVPDSNYCLVGDDGSGVEGWVEFKQTSGWAVTLRPEQVGWITRRCRYGGRVFIAVRRQNAGGVRRGDPVDELWLLRGSYARELLDRGLKHGPAEAILGRWMGGPSQWDWDSVRHHLLHL